MYDVATTFATSPVNRWMKRKPHPPTRHRTVIRKAAVAAVSTQTARRETRS